MPSPHKKIYIAISIVSILLMLAVANLPFKTKPFGDITFHAEAKSMALFLKGYLPASEAIVTKAPGPVIFYTPAYLLAPSDATDNELWYYGVGLTTILITIAMILIYRTAYTFFGRATALLSVMLFMIFPIHCYYSLGIIGEAPAFFSLSVAIYGWSAVWVNPARKWGWACIVVGMLLLILNRPNAMLIFGFVILVLVYSWIRARAFFDCYAKQIAISFTMVALLGIAILQGAKNISGNSDSDSQDNLLYYVAHQGRFQFREEPTDFRFWDNEIRGDSKDYNNWRKSGHQLGKIMDATGKSYKEVYREFLIDDAIEHPWLFMRQFFVKCFYGHVYIINSVNPETFSLGPLQGRIGYNILLAVINIVNIIIIAGGVMMLFLEKNQLRFWMFWGVLLSLLIFHGLTYMEPRYLFPSKAALYILSAAGLCKLRVVRHPLERLASKFYSSAH